MRLVRAHSMAIGLVGLLVAPITAFSQGASYETLAFSDQPAPGGGVFSGFTDATIGANGVAGFSAFLQNESSISISGTPGVLNFVAQRFSSAPGTGGAEFQSFERVSVAQDGRVAFGASAYGESAFFQGVWIQAPGGGIAEGILDEMGSFGPPSFRSGSVLAVKSETSGEGGPQTALWYGTPGVLEILLSTGDPAPGFSGNAEIDSVYGYDEFTGPGPSVDANEAGQLALKVIVDPTPTSTPSPRGVIYAGAPDALQIVAAERTEIPAMPGATLEEVSAYPSLASNGSIAFSATFFDNSQESTTSAVLAGLPGALKVIARKGDAVPTAPGVVFGPFGKTAINETGDVIFAAEIYYPNQTSRHGIWIQRLTGPAVLIAIDGMTLATPQGDQLVTSVDFAGPGSFNDLHQFVFRAETEAGTGLFLADTRPGAPLLRVTRPARRKDQVTQDRVVRIAGVATDDTGIAKVEYTVEPIGKSGTRRERNRIRKLSRTPQLAKGDANWHFKVPLASGRNRISITATDKLGNVSDPLEFVMIRYACKCDDCKDGRTRHRRPRR